MRTLTFAAGLATGYVLGTKAGREKYYQISAAARRFGEQPLISQAQSALKDAAHTTGQAAAAKIATLAPNAPEEPANGATGSGAQPSASMGNTGTATARPKTTPQSTAPTTASTTASTASTSANAAKSEPPSSNR